MKLAARQSKLNEEGVKKANREKLSEEILSAFRRRERKLMQPKKNTESEDQSMTLFILLQIFSEMAKSESEGGNG